MALFDGIIKWVANHTVAVVVIGLAMAALVLFFSITETGKAGWELMVRQPFYFVLFGLLLASPVAVYYWMLGVKIGEANRAAPETVWIAARRRYQGYFRNGDMPRQVRRDEVEGFYFTGWIFPNNYCTVKLCDRLGNKLGMLMDGGYFFGIEKIDKYMKKKLSAEERIAKMGADQQWMETLKQGAKQEEEAAVVGIKKEGV